MSSGALPEAALRACLSSMDADASQYTTAAAADDLDEILGALGYAAVNVLGLPEARGCQSVLPSLVRSAITLLRLSPLKVRPVSVVSTPAVPAPSPIG